MRYPVSPTLGLLLLVAGCASQPQPRQNASATGIQCPAGNTLTCEARTTGRIYHGSFSNSKDNDHCACVPEGFELPASPVIPGIR